jgi:hypothetical protein
VIDSQARAALLPPGSGLQILESSRLRSPAVSRVSWGSDLSARRSESRRPSNASNALPEPLGNDVEPAGLDGFGEPIEDLPGQLELRATVGADLLVDREGLGDADPGCRSCRTRVIWPSQRRLACRLAFA